MNLDRDQLVELPDNLPPRLREYVEPLQTDKGRTWLNYAVGALAALSLLAMLSAGASTPADPVLGAATTTTTLPPPRPARVPGFNEVHIGVSNPPYFSTSLKHFCALHAATADGRTRGLQGRTDLAGYDAMVFSFDADTNAPFTSRNYRIPVTVLFFDASGRHLGSVDMPPCIRRRRCPTYGAPGDQRYRFALQVQQGQADRLGISFASMVTANGGCV